MFLSTKNNWKAFLQYALLNVFVNYGATKKLRDTVSRQKYSSLCEFAYALQVSSLTLNEHLSDSSEHYAEQRTSHTDHKERVSHQYEFSNGEQEQLTDWMTWNIEDIYEVSLQYELSCGHAAGLIQWMI
jgi:hypothetical protein